MSLRPTTTNSLSTASILLSFYTDLLTNWIAQLQALSVAPIPSQSATISALTNHLTHFPLIILTSTPPSQSSCNIVLSHYSTYLSLLRPPLSLPIAPPLPLVISLLLLAHPTLSTLNHLSSLLAAYKIAYETPNPLETTPRAAGHIKALNSSLMYVLLAVLSRDLVLVSSFFST